MHPLAPNVKSNLTIGYHFRGSVSFSLKCAYLPLYRLYKKNFQTKVFPWRLLYIFDHYKNPILSNPLALNFKNLLTKIPKIELFSFIMKNMKDGTKFVVTKTIQLKILLLKSSSPYPTPGPLKDPSPGLKINFFKRNVCK